MSKVNKPESSHTTYLQAIPGSEDLLMPIPDQILESEDWRVGDVLIVEVARGGIVLTNKSKQLREQSPDQSEQP